MCIKRVYTLMISETWILYHTHTNLRSRQSRFEITCLLLDRTVSLTGSFRQEEWEQGGCCEWLFARNCGLRSHSAFHVSVFSNPHQVSVAPSWHWPFWFFFTGICMLLTSWRGCGGRLLLGGLSVRGLPSPGLEWCWRNLGERDTIIIWTKYHCFFVGLDYVPLLIASQVVVSTRKSDRNILLWPQCPCVTFILILLAIQVRHQLLFLHGKEIQTFMLHWFVCINTDVHEWPLELCETRMALVYQPVKNSIENLIITTKKQQSNHRFYSDYICKPQVQLWLHLQTTNSTLTPFANHRFYSDSICKPQILLWLQLQTTDSTLIVLLLVWPTHHSTPWN
jgi:hypothetical protein